MNWDGFVGPVDQGPANQPGFVALAPIRVKEPVFGDPEGGVVLPLADFVPAGGVVGGHFQHEIGRLALLPDGISLLGNDAGAPDVESDEQVGNPHAGAAGGHIPGDGNLAEDNCGFRVAQMQTQGSLVAVIVEIGGVHHIGAGRKVGELSRNRRVRRGVRLRHCGR